MFSYCSRKSKRVGEFSKVNELRLEKVTAIKTAVSNNRGEGYIDTAVKILIAVVLGALLLAGLYALFGDESGSIRIHYELDFFLCCNIRHFDRIDNVKIFTCDD